MNYEELISKGIVKAPTKNNLPIGMLTKREVDGKYVNAIRLRADLAEDPMFRKAVDSECKANSEFNSPHILHFTHDDSDDNWLDVEQGSYVTIDKQINDAPAILASRKFIDNLFEGLLDITEMLHTKGIFHECYAPSTVVIRKGDSSPLLLTNGSYYTQLVSPAKLYEGFENYIAPEILDGGTVDERCDIYSIGKFMESIFDMVAAPVEYKQLIKKATSKMPEDRYQSIGEMRKALNSKKKTMQSVKTGIVAVAIALLCVGAYFYVMPEANTTEFVKPAPKEPDPNLLDDGFNPETELGPIGDSIADLTPERVKQIEMYQAKSESIFRKRFTVEAERILSKVYDKSYMNTSEKQFLAGSSSMTEELGKVQIEIANAAGLDGTRSNAIATEIVEKISNQKKNELKRHGVQK